MAAIFANTVCSYILFFRKPTQGSIQSFPIVCFQYTKKNSDKNLCDTKEVKNQYHLTPTIIAWIFDVVRKKVYLLLLFRNVWKNSNGEKDASDDRKGKLL